MMVDELGTTGILGHSWCHKKLTFLHVFASIFVVQLDTVMNGIQQCDTGLVTGCIYG